MIAPTEHFDAEAQRAAFLVETALEVRALSDTVNYLQGILSHKRSILKAALEATGHKSSTKLIPGVTLKLMPSHTLVCSCHGDDAMACPSVRVGVAVPLEIRVNGTYLSVDFASEYSTPIEPYDGPAPAERAA